MKYPFRDALVDVLDQYEADDPREIVDALVSALVACAYAEGLDEGCLVRRVTDAYLATRFLHDAEPT